MTPRQRSTPPFLVQPAERPRNAVSDSLMIIPMSVSLRRPCDCEASPDEPPGAASSKLDAPVAPGLGLTRHS